MTWSWEVAERDHEIQDPTSAEKVRLLGEYLRLDSSSRVLDLACGKAGPAIVLAEAFGCRIHGVELRPQFADEARTRIAERGLGDLVSIETGDAAAYPLEQEAWDAALCLGASFVWGHIGDAAKVLTPAVRSGGFVAIGEPFRRQAGGAEAEGFVDLAATVERFQSGGLALTGLIAASEDDWDRYESLHWRARGVARRAPRASGLGGDPRTPPRGSRRLPPLATSEPRLGDLRRPQDLTPARSRGAHRPPTRRMIEKGHGRSEPDPHCGAPDH